jgi:hypothetical protein
MISLDVLSRTLTIKQDYKRNETSRKLTLRHDLVRSTWKIRYILSLRGRVKNTRRVAGNNNDNEGSAKRMKLQWDREEREGNTVEKKQKLTQYNRRSIL